MDAAIGNVRQRREKQRGRGSKKAPRPPQEELPGRGADCSPLVGLRRGGVDGLRG